MVLEPTAVIFGPDQFRNSLGGLYREMVGRLFDDSEIVLPRCGDTTHLAKEMAQTGVVGLSLDSMVDFPTVAQFTGQNVRLIGNIAPVEMLSALANVVYIQTYRLLEQTAETPLMVLSTGCDLPQDVPFESIDAFFRAGRNRRRESKNTNQFAHIGKY